MSDGTGAATFDAVILAGGRGSRLGGVSKADLLVGGVRLLDRVLAAAREASTTVVVGAVAVPAGVLTTQESPAGSGPAAGIAAGLDAIATPAEWTVVLACDVPEAATAVSALRAATGPGVSALALAGADGGPEWLIGMYRSATLRAAVAAYGDPRNRSVRGMLGPLSPTLVPSGPVPGSDIDTWADHARWNAHYRRSRRRPSPPAAAWEPFVRLACEAVDVEPSLVDIDAILEMTREIAHAGARPMAPVSAYILGLAVGRGGDAEHLRRVLEDAASAAPLPPAADDSADPLDRIDD